jgi:hypothetical protein
VFGKVVGRALKTTRPKNQGKAEYDKQYKEFKDAYHEQRAC